MIDVQDLSFTYRGGSRPAVDNLSFHVQIGEVLGFLGPSGAGKSTTQKILIGILHGWSGSVRLLDNDLTKHGRELYEQVGVSFELPNVYSKLTARENLAFFATLYDGDTAPPEELLEQVGLADAADTRVAHFSKGMKMRLNFCRALLCRPRLLFLDEPTGGQDPTNAARIKQIVREQQKAGTTVFLTTHDMVAARELCDRVAFIVDGRIAALDTPRNLTLEHGSQRVRVEYRDNGDVSAREFPLDGLGHNPDFATLLSGHAVETIHSLEASLADVFIEVTGRQLA